MYYETCQNNFLVFFLPISLVQKGSSIAFAWQQRKISLRGLAVTKLRVETRMVYNMMMMFLQIVTTTSFYGGAGLAQW